MSKSEDPKLNPQFTELYREQKFKQALEYAKQSRSEFDSRKTDRENIEALVRESINNGSYTWRQLNATLRHSFNTDLISRVPKHRLAEFLKIFRINSSVYFCQRLENMITHQIIQKSIHISEFMLLICAVTKRQNSRGLELWDLDLEELTKLSEVISLIPPRENFNI